jgi:transcriptional regulator
MYLPKYFAETEIAVMHALMRAHPLATVVNFGPEGLDANPIPLHLDAETGPNGTLRGHIARANPMSKAITVDGEVLVIFQGTQGYISPSGYATKTEHGKVVPTWNYTAVHAKGALRLIDDSEWILTHLHSLTSEHEAGLSHPWAVDDAPADYIAKLLGAIVGIEISMTSLVGKWKASQNQPAVNQASLMAALNGQPMAELIRSRAVK